MKTYNKQRRINVKGSGYNSKYVAVQKGDGLLDIFKTIGKAISRTFLKSGLKEGSVRIASNVADRIKTAGIKLFDDNKDRIVKKAKDLGKEVLDKGIENTIQEVQNVIDGKRTFKGAVENAGLKTLESAFEKGQPVISNELSSLRDKIKLQADLIVKDTAEDLDRETAIVRSNIEKHIEETNIVLETQGRRIRGAGLTRLGERRIGSGLTRLGEKPLKKKRGRPRKSK